MMAGEPSSLGQEAEIIRMEELFGTIRNLPASNFTREGRYLVYLPFNF
jgi:hypothetical protein